MPLSFLQGRQVFVNSNLFSIWLVFREGLLLHSHFKNDFSIQKWPSCFSDMRYWQIEHFQTWHREIYRYDTEKPTNWQRKHTDIRDTFRWRTWPEKPTDRNQTCTFSWNLPNFRARVLIIFLRMLIRGLLIRGLLIRESLIRRLLIRGLNKGTTSRILPIRGVLKSRVACTSAAYFFKKIKIVIN